jgi:hypothetical protein
MFSNCGVFRSSTPISVLQCFGNDGCLDVSLFYQNLAERRKYSNKSSDKLDEVLLKSFIDAEDENPPKEPTKRNRRRIIN